jgi:single-strand DNA-binding protein
MASDLNQCNFIGRVGRDAELVGSNNNVCKFSLAVNEEYLDKNTGEKVRQTEWVNCVAFSKLAEVCMRFMKKGAKAYVSGKFKVTKYVGKDGMEKSAVQINVNEMQVLTFVEGSSEDDKPLANTGTNNFDDIPF